MATIQEYLEAAKGAIISGASDRAIALCQHILRYYPKHLEAHCLVAEAYRERGNATLAENLLLRVLSADPESLIARWGLSELHGQNREHDEALGQLRIALEVNPDHPELRRELVHLSGGKAKPTVGGLARLYMRGGLFDYAIVEYEAALDRQPERLDLLVGLAEALWRAGRDDEALELCQRIRDDSPDCLKALLIASFTLAARGKQLDESAVVLWQSAHALDPEHQVARELAAPMGRALPADLWSLISAPGHLPDPEDKELHPNRLLRPASDPATAEWDEALAPPPPAAPPAAPVLSEASLPPLAPGSRSPGIAAAMPEDEDTDLLHYEAEIAALASELEEAAGPTAPTRPASPQQPLPQEQEAVTPSAPSGAGGDDETASPDRLRDTGSDPSLLGGGEAPLSEREWGEWADLLNEEITLDSDAEARLTAALTEAQPTHGDGHPANGAAGVATPEVAPLSGSSLWAPIEQPPLPPAPAPGQEYIEALETDPANHQARLALAMTYQQLGHADAAVREFGNLLRMAPQMVGDVVDGLRGLIAITPTHPAAHRALGNAYMKTGRFQQAIDEFNQALNLEKAGR